MIKAAEDIAKAEERFMKKGETTFKRDIQVEKKNKGVKKGGVVK